MPATPKETAEEQATVVVALKSFFPSFIHSSLLSKHSPEVFAIFLLVLYEHSDGDDELKCIDVQREWIVLMFCLAFMTSDNDVTNGFGFGRNTKHPFFIFIFYLPFFLLVLFIFFCSCAFFLCVPSLHFSILVFLDADFSFPRHSVSKGGYSIFVGRALGGLSPLWVLVFLLVCFWGRAHLNLFAFPFLLSLCCMS